MSDIVQRLRDYTSPALAHEAADEIERLRAALRIFADDENWRFGRRFDPNGSRFDGTAVAQAALAGDQTTSGKP